MPFKSNTAHDRSLGSLSRRTRAPSLAPLFKSGGVVYVSNEAYLRRLQSIYAAGNVKAHSNLLYPGLAHLLTTSESNAQQMVMAILVVSQAGRKLQGLESIFLSCLQNLQAKGHRQLALAAILAWGRYRYSGKRRIPLVLVDRSSNQLKYFPARAAANALETMSAGALLRSTVFQVAQAAEGQRAIESSPSGILELPEEVADCTSKAAAWTAVGITVASAAAAAAGAAYAPKGSDPFTSGISMGANFVQLVGEASLAIFGMISAYGCADSQGGASQGDVTQATNTILGALLQQAQLQSAEALANLATAIDNSTGEGNASSTDGATLGNYTGGVLTSDPFGLYSTSPDSATTPPDTTTEPDEPADPTDSTPNPDDPGTTGDGPSSTPNPDDDGESNSYPPGSHWPGSNDMPNPDDPGPAGPVAFPSGAVFLPAAGLTALTRAAGMAVSSQVTSISESGVATVQFSAANALGGP